MSETHLCIFMLGVIVAIHKNKAVVGDSQWLYRSKIIEHLKWMIQKNPWQNICDPFWQNKNKVAGKLTRLLINTSPGGHFNNSMFLIFSHCKESALPPSYCLQSIQVHELFLKMHFSNPSQIILLWLKQSTSSRLHILKVDTPQPPFFTRP